MSAHDVVIVGGRVAGAATAMLLARAGLRVALLERGRRGADTVSTHGLMRAGVTQLSRWGLTDRVVAAGTPAIRRTRFHYPDGEVVRVSIKPGPGVDALYAPRRTVLDPILLEAAEQAGAQVLHGTAVTSLLRDDEGRVRGVLAGDARGSAFPVEGTITVGADGIRSVVAQQVGAALLRQGHAASAVLYRYAQDLPVRDFEWIYGDGAAAGLIPTNDGATCVFVGTTPARMRQLRRSGQEQAFASLLAGASPDLVDRLLDCRGWSSMRGWGGVPGHVRQSWGPGWALVGDAGYFKDPITAHGITDALRDAELVADAILETLSGRVQEAIAMAAYQATRERLSRRLFEATEEIAGYGWDSTRARELLRTASSAMSDEVDHLQSLPERATSERRFGPAIGAFIPTDFASRAG
jgi:flavin-dependent dehydrogenase